MKDYVDEMNMRGEQHAQRTADVKHAQRVADAKHAQRMADEN